MNMKEEALKLADELQDLYKYSIDDVGNRSADMIRKLVAELEDLKHDNEELLKSLTAERTPRELSDEEILKIIKKHEAINGNIDTYDVLACVKAILKKASEK